MNAMSREYQNPIYIENDRNQNQDIKKSFEDINKKLQIFQKELKNISLTSSGQKSHSTQYKDFPLNTIERRVQTLATTQSSIDNTSRAKSFHRSDSSYQKEENPIYKKQNLMRSVISSKIANSSKQSEDSHKGATASIKHSDATFQLNADDEPLERQSSNKRLNHTEGDENTTRKKDYIYSSYTKQIKLIPPRGNDVRMTLDEAKDKLKKIFQYYTTFGDRCNTSYLKSNKFHKMMVDAGVRDQHLTQKDLDLLFVSETKHRSNLDYEAFLQLLVKIVEQMYRSMPSREALDKFLNDHMIPLYNKLYRLNGLAVEDTKLKEPIIERVIVVLKSVHTLLLKVYQTYFPWEIQTSQQLNVIKQRDEVVIFSLLKDFDVCPTLMTKGAVTMIWTEVIEASPQELSRNPKIKTLIPFMEKDVGTFFTFSKFCALLIRIASIVYEEYLKVFDFPIGQAEKLTMLLERMDMSTGMQDFERKTATTHNSKTSLLVPKQILEKARLQEFDDSQLNTMQSSKQDMLQTIPESNNSTTTTKRSKSVERIQQIANGSANTSYSQKNMGNISMNRSRDISRSSHTKNQSQLEAQIPEDVETAIIYEKYAEDIKRVFQHYCSFGEAANTNQLKLTKFSKLLRESDLLTSLSTSGYSHKEHHVDKMIRQLTQAESELIFTTITASKHQKEALENSLRFNPKTKGLNQDLFNSLQRNNLSVIQQSGKMSFEGFLKAIGVIAQRLLPDVALADAIELVIGKLIIQLQNQTAQASNLEFRYMGGGSLTTLIDLLKDSEVVSFLGIVHKSLITYYNYYADKRGLINFEKFINFCKDFAIFPGILSKVRIKTIFQTLAVIYAQTRTNDEVNPNINTINNKLNTSQPYMSLQKKTVDPNEEVIDQHLFIESIALCAFEVSFKDPQPHSIYKICFLLERMNQSQGPVNVQIALGLKKNPSGASWDIMAPIKQKYSDIFTTVRTEGGYNKKSKFDDIMS